MLQTMKRENKGNSGNRKPSGKSGDYKSSPREQRTEGRSTPKRFFGDKADKSPQGQNRPHDSSERDQKSNPRSHSNRKEGNEEGRQPFKKANTGRGDSRADWGGNKKYGSGNSEKPFGSKSSSGNKSDFERGERSSSYDKSSNKKSGSKWSEKPRGRRSEGDKPYFENERRSKPEAKDSYRFGSEWKKKSETDPSNESRFNPEREQRNPSDKSTPFKRSADSSSDNKNPEEYKTVYKGRGKDQKPRYETVRKDETSQFKSSKKFFSKTREGGKPTEPKPKYDFGKFEQKLKKQGEEDEIRLNKYIANAGVCSRREADTLIANGLISVNGNVVKELGHKVKRKDKVQYQGRTLNPEKPVYLLLNKPKDFITTTDDPMERKTVMNLVANACEERIFPVGRLDRNTTGLLLFTNDGELADKLSSPANKIKKIYQVTLDKPLTKNDAEAISEGLTLDDGPVKVNDMQVLSLDRTILGLEIHIGRNRIVRRIFAHLGYDVIALDRVVYAGLTKKDLARGNFRFLAEKEVINLKFFK